MSSKPILVGVSGPSSCGKTTLARLLTRIFPHTSILHADDFYFPDSQIPWRGDVQDWDCAEAIDVKKLVAALKRLKAGETVEAVHDGVASTEIPEEEVEGVKAVIDKESLELLKIDVATWEKNLKSERKDWARSPLVIIDGFLLFGDSVRGIRDELDIKILLRSTYDDSKKRREARSGYQTIEGFWEDPPNYFDKIVWPNYIKNHEFLFQGSDVQGPVNETASERFAIEVVPGMGQKTLEETLNWVVDLVKRRIAATGQSPRH